jgi:NAD+ kinase
MKLGIIGNRKKRELPDAVRRLLSCLDKAGIPYVIDRETAALGGPVGSSGSIGSELDCVTGTDILLAFGGDGTILSAARLVGPKGVPILGINLGKLGFLAEVAPNDIEVAVDDLLHGNYSVEKRLLLEASSSALPGRNLFAVNDFVVAKARSSRMVDVETRINGEFAVLYRGDGLIISTPTGSTAYALSNGGPIVTPTSQVIGLTPISPHTLSGRPLVVPDDVVIDIVARAEEGDVMISADGQEEAMVTPPVSMAVRRAGHSLHLVKRPTRSYFDVLRAKLLWGRDPRSPA